MRISKQTDGHLYGAGTMHRWYLDRFCDSGCGRPAQEQELMRGIKLALCNKCLDKHGIIVGADAALAGAVKKLANA